MERMNKAQKHLSKAYPNVPQRKIKEDSEFASYNHSNTPQRKRKIYPRIA